MKRESSIKVALLLLSLLIGFYFVAKLDFRSSFAMEEAVIKEEEYQKIILNRQPYEEDFSIDLIINDYTLPYDEETDMFLYSLTEGDSKAFNPTIQTHSTDYTGYEVVLLEKDMTTEVLKQSKPMNLLIYNDDYYKEYSIAFTTLPIITIDMEEPSTEGEYPISTEDEWAQFELYDNRENVPSMERLVQSRTYVRLRGATSLAYPQKQMRLNLRDVSIGGEKSTKHLSLLDMRKDDDWILYAPYSDPEKMRNTFSTNLWYETSAKNNPLGVDNGTEGKFVEVFVDDRYWGIYTLMYPIDDKQLDLDENKDEPLKSDFYYRIFSNISPQLEVFKQTGNSLTAGSAELRYPDEPLNDYRQWTPLIEHLDAMKVEEKENLSDYLYSKVDLENQIDYFLFYTFTQAYDNDTKNRNYIAYWQKDQHMILESPWDLDLTWGNRWNAEQPLNITVQGSAEENPVLYPSLITRSLQDGLPEITQEIIKRYTELRENEWSEETLLNKLDQYEQDIYGSGAAQRNHERWPEAAHADDASALKQYVKQRLKHMDRYVYQDVQGGTLYDGNEQKIPE